MRGANEIRNRAAIIDQARKGRVIMFVGTGVTAGRISRVQPVVQHGAELNDIKTAPERPAATMAVDAR
jgi:hypothetical protein